MMICLLSKIHMCLTCLILISKTSNAIFDDNDLRTLQKELAVYLRLDKYKEMEPKNFKRILDSLNLNETLGKVLNPERTLCRACQFLIIQLQRRNLAVRAIGEALCNIYITLSTLTVTSFCTDIVRLNLPILEYIVENSDILDPELACTILLQNKQCYYNKSELKWRTKITPKQFMKVPQITNDPTVQPIKIIHLSDFHLTPDYEIGGVSDCGYPICCKRGLGNPINRKERAGTWGDYNCDIPLWLFGETMRHINNTHKDIDIVYFTGDIIDHTIWKASRKDNSKIIYYAYRTLFETFPGVPILPVIGNHEAVPLNVFSPPTIQIDSLSTQWLYDLLSKIWRSWLSPDALVNVQKQGYYSYAVNKRFKIISLNNNVCYNLNWWLLYNTTFLGEQLEFLKQELEESERIGQFVHIITHIAVGNKECIEPWEVNYNALIKRFSHIIKGQFYGHTHTDELKIFYDDDKAHAINMGYNGASLTPYVKYNPNYKLMIVDPNTYDVLDIETYYFNLTEANMHPNRTPLWSKLYSMKNDYKLNSLSPKSFDSLAENMFSNDTLSELYWRFYTRAGDPSLKDGCDSQCKKEMVCKISTTESMSPVKDYC